MTRRMRLRLPGRLLQNSGMRKWFPTKDRAAAVLRSDASFFYVYGIVVAVFASYLSVREQSAEHFALLIGAILLVAPAYLAENIQSRIAASALVFFAFAQLIGAVVTIGTSIGGVLNLLFSGGLFLLALRMLITTIVVNRRDTIES